MYSIDILRICKLAKAFSARCHFRCLITTTPIVVIYHSMNGSNVTTRMSEVYLMSQRLMMTVCYSFIILVRDNLVCGNLSI